MTPRDAEEHVALTVLIGILLLGCVVVGSWIVRDLKGPESIVVVSGQEASR